VSGRSDDELRTQIDGIVRAAMGSVPVRLDELSAGLGTRRFFRAELDAGAPTSLIVRVEPAEPAALPAGIAPEPSMEPIRDFLERSGLPVPARLADDTEAGITLLEDLGDESLEAAAAHVQPAQRRALYEQACNLIPRLQRLAPPEPALPAFERRLDAALIASKAVKWIEWAVPALLHRQATPAERQTVMSAFAFIAEIAETAPARLAHRDFKAANLHRRPGARGRPELVMIDVQGAFLAPPEYDLVCLLRDSHMPLPESEVAAHCERVRIELPDSPSPDDFARRFDLLTLARVSKDLSHYLEAARNRDDTRYLAFVPAGLANLRAAAPRAAERDAILIALADHFTSIPADAMTDALGETTCAP